MLILFIIIIILNLLVLIFLGYMYFKPISNWELIKSNVKITKQEFSPLFGIDILNTHELYNVYRKITYNNNYKFKYIKK